MSSRFEHLLQALLNGEGLDDFKPLSRIEECLINCCRRIGRDGLPEPHSRAEFLLQELADQLASGDSGGIIPSGSITITENGEYDVTEKATAIVEVEGDEPIIVPLEITENGTYTAQEGIDGYSPITVNVEGDGDGVSVYEVADADELPDDAAEGSIGIVEFENNTDEGIVKQTIEGTATEIKDDTVESIRDYAFYNYEKNLVSVDFPNLKSIGDYAFVDCFNLALTSLPSGVTNIGLYAFNSCTNLALTSLPSGVTSIANYAFNGCSNLALTSLPSGVTSIGTYAFNNCTNLALTSLPSGVTSIGTYAFCYCPKLALTSLPSGITSIGGQAFYNCTGITSITFEGTPTSINSTAFNGCSNLTIINVPWAEGEVANAPWSATNATINYNYTGG